MNAEQAHTAITVAALVTVGAWAYRKLVEPAQVLKGESHKNPVAAALGVGSAPANSAQFAIGFGFVFISLAVISTFAPGPAGGLAVTEAIGVVLINGAQVFSDVNEQVAASTTTEKKKPAKK